MTNKQQIEILYATMKKNPDLEVKIFVADEISDKYLTLHYIYKIEISYFAEYDGKYFDSQAGFLDHLTEDCGIEDLDEVEIIEKAYAKQAIIIYTGAA